MLSMSLTLGVVATLQPLIALGLTIPEASQAEDISPRNVGAVLRISSPPTPPIHGLTVDTLQPAADGKCMVDSGFAGWCGIDGLHNGCLDGDCNAFNIGAGCHCDDPHRYVSNWGCLDGSFCYRKAESGCEDEGEVEEDLPVDDTNPLIAWCNAGNEIPALSVVAGVYENTMIYTCNFLDKPIGCDFNKEVQAGIDQEIGLCGYGKPGKWTVWALFHPQLLAACSMN